MARKKETIEIPLELARLLAARDDDFKTTQGMQEGREIARAMLRLLLAVEE